MLNALAVDQRPTLFTNATVLTMDDASPEAEAIAVERGLVRAVGSDTDARDALRDGFDEVDLGGATVLPGFIDAHHHIMTLGYWMAQIDCSFPSVTSIPQIVEAVGRRVAATGLGEWVQGRGYDPQKLNERRHVTRHDLDRVSSNNPVMIRHASGHMAVVNSVALKMAGISETTADPFGGHIDIGEDGTPTGLLQEKAQDLLGVPFLTKDKNELREHLRVAGEAYLAAGVTSGHEAGIFDPAEFGVFQEAWMAGELALRTYMMIRAPMLDALEGVGFFTGFGDDWLRVGSIKLISDGSLIGRTAAVCQPFEHARDSDGLGLAMYTQEELDDLVWRGHSAGWQMAIHAIGDRAIDMCLDAYAEALKRKPTADHRHRIEHCGVMRSDQIARMAQMGVIPVGQPPFIAEFGDGFLENLGRDRCQLTYPIRSLLDAGVPLAGSSDSPVSSYHPLIGIQAAVTETTMEGRSFAPNEAVTLERALSLYTRNAAHAAFEDEKKGSIAPGKLADLAILARDPRLEPKECLATIPVAGTVQGGRLVYQAPIEGTA